METLSDSEVLALARSKMAPHHNDRLGQLQSQGKAGTLTLFEQFELLVLVHLYQIGQLRKSQGLAEIRRRGLPHPFSS